MTVTVVQLSALQFYTYSSETVKYSRVHIDSRRMHHAVPWSYVRTNLVPVLYVCSLVSALVVVRYSGVGVLCACADNPMCDFAPAALYASHTLLNYDANVRW